MATVEDLEIAFTGQGLSDLIRLLNDKLRRVQSTINLNYRLSYPDLFGTVSANGTYALWIPNSDLEIEGWTLRMAAVTTNPTVVLKIDGGSAVDTQVISDTTVHEFELSTPEVVDRLSRIEITTSNQTSGELLSISLRVRRLSDA